MRGLAFFVIVFLLIGCESNVDYTEYVSLPNGWSKNQPVIFQYDTNDTIAKKDIFLMIRNNQEYPFGNIFVITKMEMPNDKVIVDTLEYEMATPEGKWLGYGYSAVKESKLWYKEGITFPEKGKYIFKIEQAMRKVGENEGINVLKGIAEIGLRIENQEKN